MPDRSLSDTQLWRLALIVTAALTLARVLVLCLSPLQLYYDEAQYWDWSRHLAFGYFTKPPMIAWVIAATTAVFGEAEWAVRLSSPLLHAAAGLCIYAAAKSLYAEPGERRIPLVALLIYQVAPAVQLGSFVVSTDTSLCAFLAAALWFYARLQRRENGRRALAALAFGLALGLAFLAKFAALYAVIGVVADLAARRDARRAWRWPMAALAVAGFALAAGPSIAWNASHGFATVGMTAREARWGQTVPFNVVSLAAFLGAQLGVFGPVPFVALIAGAILLAVRRRLRPADLLLLCWTAPPIVLVAVQAFISRANANWAVAAYVPASALVAAWLMRWRAQGWTLATVVGQGGAALVFAAVMAWPGLADMVGAGHALRDFRGWREATDALVARARLESQSGPLSAVAVDTRYLYEEGRYYGRDYFVAGAPPLEIIDLDRTPGSGAEATAPLTPASGARVVFACSGNPPVMMSLFQASAGLQLHQFPTDRRHTREVDIFVGTGFRQPAPP